MIIACYRARLIARRQTMNVAIISAAADRLSYRRALIWPVQVSYFLSREQIYCICKLRVLHFKM